MARSNKRELLEASNDMEPVAGTVDLDIPAEILWAAFDRGDLWSRWNPCMSWVANRRLEVGRQLIWVFEPIRWYYFYKFPALAKIDEIELGEGAGATWRVTWEVNALLGFYARHTYHVEDLGDGRCRFGSWEKAHGWNFRLARWFWLAHFRFVKDESLAGAQYLEAHYKRHGVLSPKDVPRRRSWLWGLISFFGFWASLAALVVGAWFYAAYVQLEHHQLAPGIDALLGGGGNSLVIVDGEEAFVVDPKFAPGSKLLGRWIDGHVEVPIKGVIDTHYHYDHARGNVEYPGATIWAAAGVPEFLQADEPDYWGRHPQALPDALIDPGRAEILELGSMTIELHAWGPGHTHGDLWLYIPDHDVVMTGDMFFHAYYPAFDLSAERGADLPRMSDKIRELAARYPSATFIPGHGPLATAEDAVRYADYLDFLWAAVAEQIAAGASEDEATSEIDLSSWDRKVLPNVPGLIPEWITADTNVRDVYRLQTR